LPSQRVALRVDAARWIPTEGGGAALTPSGRLAWRGCVREHLRDSWGVSEVPTAIDAALESLGASGEGIDRYLYLGPRRGSIAVVKVACVKGNDAWRADVERLATVESDGWVATHFESLGDGAAGSAPQGVARVRHTSHRGALQAELRCVTPCGDRLVTVHAVSHDPLAIQALRAELVTVLASSEVVPVASTA